MALTDFTEVFGKKKFEGGVNGGTLPATYGGPEPESEDASAETLKASVMGIYEKYGRSAKGMRMAKASPEYAALKGAGISVFGTPTSNNSGMDSNKKQQTTNIENASDETKSKAASQYAALNGRPSGRTPRTGSSALTNAVNGGAEVTPPAQNKPRVPESTPQTAQSTSMSALNPPATPATETPKTEPVQAIPETTKDSMASNMAARDKINRQSLRGGASGITAQDATDMGYGKGLEGQGGRMLDNSDASAKMMRADERNKLQDEREAMKKEYNSQASANPSQASAPSMVAKGETYQGPGGKEFVGRKTSEGFIGVPSENQNKIDEKARANLKKKYSGPSLQS